MTETRGGAPRGSAEDRVLFLAGSGRSGSTLLNRMLGEIPGFIAVGEMRHLWREGLIEDRLCGCGQPFSRCGFWQDVGDEAFGGWARISAGDMIRLERAVSRHRDIPLVLARGIVPSFGRLVRTYVGALSSVYSAIRKVGDGSIVVDSTKDPAHGLLLRSSPDVDLRIVHLVRDSRAVAFAWTRDVPTGETSGRDVRMHRYRTAETAARWLAFNALIELVGAGIPYLRVRYEDLVVQPVRHLEDIVTLADGRSSADALAFLSQDRIRLREHHTVAGNPMRLATGSIALRRDDAWESEMGQRSRSLVGAMTAPLLVRYGYPVRGGSSRASGVVETG